MYQTDVDFELTLLVILDLFNIRACAMLGASLDTLVAEKELYN
jgi:hypothetical protein